MDQFARQRHKCHTASHKNDLKNLASSHQIKRNPAEVPPAPEVPVAPPEVAEVPPELPPEHPRQRKRSEAMSDAVM